VVPGLPGVATLPRVQQEQWVTWVHLHVDSRRTHRPLHPGRPRVWFIARRPMLRWLLVIGLGVFPWCSWARR
jgi:hypothetical protein